MPAKVKKPKPSAKKTKSSRAVSSRANSERSRGNTEGRAVRARVQPQPVASRPVVPPGYRFPTSPEGLLDWTWARERLTNSHNYVVVTVRPDSRPHAMGMHGIWFEDAYYFGTDSASRKAKNLQHNPNCIVITEKLDEIVIVEGAAEAIGFDDAPEELSAASKSKYGWPMKPHKGGTLYRLIPRVVFAFPLEQIATAVTRWKFDR